MKLKILRLVEYLLFLVIPLSVFSYFTVRNKNRIERIEIQTPVKDKNIIQQKSSEEVLLINQGLAYINEKKYKESIEINLKVLSINPNSAIAHNNIGFAYGNLKQWNKAIEYCSKAVFLDPNFQLAINNLKWMQSKKAELKKN